MSAQDAARPLTAEVDPARDALRSQRLAAGLLQGFVLYLLYLTADARTWPASNPYWMAPLLMAAIFVPVLYTQGLGTIRPRTLAIWCAVAAIVLALLAWFDVWRQWDPPAAGFDSSMTFAFIFFTIVGLFIAQSLVTAGDAERRFFASYHGYFEAAWKLGVQLGLAALFTGVFWGVLWLGAVGTYLYDYSLGYKVLFCLSLMHIYLEFPLNHVSILGTFRELRSRWSPAPLTPAAPAPGRR